MTSAAPTTGPADQHDPARDPRAVEEQRRAREVHARARWQGAADRPPEPRQQRPRERPAGGGVAEDHEEEDHQPGPGRAGRAWMPAVAAPLAKIVSTAIAHIATTWPVNTSKLARSRRTLRTPATSANAANAPIRAAPRARLRLRA